MSSPDRLTAFEDQFLSELTDAGAEIGGWAVLTNHYHLLVGVETLDQISATLQHLHGSTSRRWNAEDELTGRRKVWYRFRDGRIQNLGEKVTRHRK
jgi:putative transposase